jgi:uncharacterized protein YdeI (YjbR/CyaY-like superfamily)
MIKKHTGAAYVSRAAVLDELLCFGWIGGLVRKLGTGCTVQLTSLCRSNALINTYCDLAAQLDREGRTQPPGRAAIARCQAVGLWMAHPDVDALVIPKVLEAALKTRPRA